MKSLQHLNKYFLKYRWRFALGTVFIVLTNIFNVYSPQLINEGVAVLRKANENYFAPLQEALKANPDLDKNEFVKSGNLELPESLQYLSKWFNWDVSDLASFVDHSDLLVTVAKLGLLLAILYIVVYIIKGIFLFYTRQTIIVMSRLIEFDLKNEVFDKYQLLSPAFYKMNNTGDIMNRISEDVGKVRMYLGPAVMYTLNLIVLFVLVVAVMLSIDVELTLYALTPLPILSVSIFYISKLINKKSEQVQRQQSHLSTLVQESISGIRVLKAYTREKSSEANFKEQSDDYKVKTLSRVKVDALFMPIIMLLVGLSTILTIYVGGIKVVNGELQIEHIFQFVFYVNMLTWPFASVGWVTSLVQQAEASQKRINEFLHITPDISNEGTIKNSIDGNIAFEKVSFTYPDSGVKALKDVSFSIKSGQTLAVLGRTGSGKSTLANLLCRLYEPASGAISIDGHTIESWDLFYLRSQVGYVPQDVFLFSDSIKNNIKFGTDNVSDSVVEQAAKDADIHDNIKEFPKGYDTLLGERGINLSGGQKQRVSIARAIIKNPSILIFDDCLSAVDTETEEKILQSLKSIMKDKTSVIISHRVSSVKHADKIIVLDDGMIIEEGSHDTLLNAGGAYAELYQKQLLEESTAESED